MKNTDIWNFSSHHQYVLATDFKLTFQWKHYNNTRRCLQK